MASHARPTEWRAPPGATRVVALGDPHGALERVKAVLARERDGRTAIVTVGDVIGYAGGPESAALVHFLAAEGIPSVRGNHEDWLTAAGDMFCVVGDAPRRLPADAAAIVRKWPLDLRVLLADRAAIRLTHSLHDPDWAWVSEETVGSLLLRTAPDRVVMTGHSHRPAIWVGERQGRPQRLAFDYLAAEALEVAIRPDARYVVDCGSLARPELSRERKDFAFGTYGVVDFAAGTLALRRVP